jgi:hypothetical protein
VSTIEPMSWETYDARSAELAKAVDTLLDRPDWLREHRLLAIYETGNAEPLGHVLAVGDGAVVVFRTTNDHDHDATDEEPGLDRRQSKTRLMQPITGEPEQVFTMASRRTQCRVSARHLIEAIDAGKKKVVVTPGRR